MRRLLSRLGGGSGSAKKARPRPGVRLGVECLEERAVPAVLFEPHFGAESRVYFNPSTGYAYNGPVLHSTPVYLIFEGSYWQSPTGVTAQNVIDSANAVLGSRYFSGLTGYGSDGSARLAGTFVDNRLSIASQFFLNPTPHYQDVFKTASLESSINRLVGGRPPSPASAPVYVVVTPPDTHNQDQPDALAYHGELTHYFLVGNVPVARQIPYAWTGVYGTTASAQLDAFSQNFSHELAEAITDPYTHTSPAVLVRSGANWYGGKLVDEIGDFEPGGFNYSYRLNGVTAVQPYWNGLPGAQGAFVVPDGNAQAFTLSPNWDTQPDAKGYLYFHHNYVLTVRGDQLADKNDVLTLDTTAAGGLRLTLNGEVVTFDPGQITNLILDTGAGADVVNVNGLPKDLLSVSLSAGAGDDVVNVNALPKGPSFAVDTGAGSDTVNLAPASGLADSLRGSLSVAGNGATVLAVYDQNTADADPAYHHQVTYSLRDGALTRDDLVAPVAPAGYHPVRRYTADVSYFGLSQVVVYGGATGNEFDVQAVTAGTPVTLYTGAGANTVRVGDASHTLEWLGSDLTVHGGGADALVLDDRFLSDAPDYSSQVLYTVGADRVVRTNDLTYTGAGGPETFEFLATVFYDGVASLTVEGGASATQFDVQATAPGSDLAIRAGGGLTNVRAQVAGLGGTLEVFGNPAGTTTLTLDDLANATPTEYDLAADSVGWEALGSEQVVPQAHYADLASLTLLGGGGGNTVRVLELPGAPLTLDAGAGVNTLDYSAYVGDVTVNLALGQATGFAGIANVWNVIGSVGNDVLVGDGNANALVGGTGRNLIVGGAGADTILGGGDDNILVAGSTAYDGDPDALLAIMQEWDRTDLGYDERVAELSGPEFGHPLNADTVFADLGEDVVVGGPAGNWLPATA